uniref:Peptidase S1 domain-containing protein n=1 Tax=Anopheles coluzzii TaxID=1518534 RepID=A0A8W7PH84_ANOCL
MDSNQELIVGRNGTIVGFGVNEQDVVSDQLKQALIGVVDPLSCIADDRGVFGTHLTSDMFCGKGQKGVSACNGDSGGGMFFEIGGRWFVRGLVSFTPARLSTALCDPLKNTAYTDVAKYLEWIKPYIDERVLTIPVRYLEAAECMRQYTQRQIVLELGNKRICAELVDKQDSLTCRALEAGAPLQETKTFNGTQRHFLWGFELHGSACNVHPPPVYIDIEAYLDWILYNMRYNVLETTDSDKITITKELLESDWSKLQ